MIELTQNQDGIIGNQKSIDELSKKQTATVLLISDSHGNYSIFNQIVQNFGKNCDALIFTGDGISDLAKLLSDSQNDPELNEKIPPVIAFARGNNDPHQYPVTKNFTLEVPVRQVLNICSQNVLVVHGHRQGVSYGFEELAFEAQLTNSKIAVFGHTHISEETYFGRNNEYKFINPGSCSLPRGGQHASFAVLTFTKTCVLTCFMPVGGFN